MKKILTVTLLFALCLVMFVGCDDGPAEPLQGSTGEQNGNQGPAGEQGEQGVPGERVEPGLGATGGVDMDSADALGFIDPRVSQAVAQHAIDWNQHLMLVEILDENGNDIEAAIAAANEQGAGIDDEGAAAVIFCFENSMNSPDPEASRKLRDEYQASIGYSAAEGGFPLTSSNVTVFYGDSRGEIEEPKPNDRFYGQDATYPKPKHYTDNGDGTITGNITGLMWQKNPFILHAEPGAFIGDEYDEDKVVKDETKYTFAEAVNGIDEFNEHKLGGYSDWRVPTIKELYSLAQFSGLMGRGLEGTTPFFDEVFGLPVEVSVHNPGDRWIDVQSVTTSIYESVTLGGTTTMFGFNFSDGRIKGYPTYKTFTVYHVRGNPHYGQNMLVDNGDGTISDLATGLMWMKYDSGSFRAGPNYNGLMNWEDALKYCESLHYAGYSDWRLPDIKELQSIVDYSRSPDTTDSAAIDPMFRATEIVGPSGLKDWGYYWSSTTFQTGAAATYIMFGRGLGMMGDYQMDVHGAGAQRSDPKIQNERRFYPTTGGPQGDIGFVNNMVRAVRVETVVDSPPDDVLHYIE